MGTAQSGRALGLDVLRGIAIALVMLRHAFPDRFGGAGIVGVVIFFTLSGYLITGVLMRDLDRFGRIRYRRFYRNRALRLLPALFVLVAVITVVALLFDPLHDRDIAGFTAIVALTYVSDIPFIHGSFAIGHLWTLSIEEQFYLVWPIILIVGAKLRRIGVVIVSAGIFLLLVGIAAALLATPSWGRLYELPSSWALSMVIGAALRLAARDPRFSRPRPAVLRATLVAASVIILGLLSLIPDLKDAGWVYAYGALLIGLCSSVLIIEMKELKITKLWGPLVCLGTISYAAYLWNYPMTLWAQAIMPSPWSSLVSICGTFVAATASWWLIERPVQAWRRRRDARAATDRGDVTISDETATV